MAKSQVAVKKLTASVATIIILACSLCVTTFALVRSTVLVDRNWFVTGTVSINLNDGEAIINENEFLFEPGATVTKDFFIQNESSCEIYYRLYFQNVSGDLANVLNVQIRDGDKILLSGTPAELDRQSVDVVDDILNIGETRTLQIDFQFPADAGNDAQNLFLSFDFAADAVQTNNNPGKEFN